MSDDPYDNHDDTDPYSSSFDNDDYDLSRNDPAPQPPQPQQQPPVNYAAAQPSYVNVPCQGCGYNLTGVAIGGTCPECGTTVDSSLYASAAAPANGFAITSMVIGIVSLASSCCCPAGFLGIVGLIFGIVAMNQINNGSYASSSRGMALAGLICSGIALLPATGWVLMIIADAF
ncbi:MAG: DUF4190 domain-containing protein [Phycisphaeraceae bacterium]